MFECGFEDFVYCCEWYGINDVDLFWLCGVFKDCLVDEVGKFFVVGFGVGFELYVCDG